MHPFASGSSIVTLTRHPSGGGPSGPSNLGASGSGTTLAFTDADGNVITSVDGMVHHHNAHPHSHHPHPNEPGVTIVTADSLVGTHFLNSAGPDHVSTKIEVDDDNDLLGPHGHHHGHHAKGPSKLDAKPPIGTKTTTEGEKKVCLWDLGNNTTCGKTFTKFDSLKRHLAESHKGVRPFACSLCEKTYGRRDYLQRHLKSHNANYAVNLQSASNISASQVVQKVQVPHPGSQSQNQKNTIILQQGQGGTLQVVSTPVGGSSSGGGGGQLGQHGQHGQPHHPSVAPGSHHPTPGGGGGGPGQGSNSSIPFLSLSNALPQAHKPLGSKICRWVNNDGTVCGKAFSKLDSLRRHVNELHKGVRPFACHMCDKNYGRRDYLDRHVKTHDPDLSKKKPVSSIEWGTSNILVTEDGKHSFSHLKLKLALHSAQIG